MIGNSKRVNVFYPILVLVLTWPLLGGYFPILSRTWIWILVGCVIASLTTPTYYRQSSMKWLLLYVFVLLVNFLTGDYTYGYFPLLALEIGVLVFCTFLPYYFFILKNYNTSRVVMIELLILISIISIFTFVLDRQIPGVLRNSVELMFGEGDTSAINLYYRLGMSNYYLPHALPIIIPPLIMGLKNKRLKVWVRFLLLVVLMLSLVLIFVSNAATAVFIAMMVLLMALITHTGLDQNNLTWFVVIVLIFLPFFIFKDLMAQTLGFLSSLFPEGNVSDRIIDLEQSLASNEAQGDVEGRMSLYTSSIDNFVTSMFLGSNNKPGGHSALIDKLAALGLIGIIPYITFIWLQFKQMSKIIPRNNRLFYYEGFLAGIMMLTFKNMDNWELWLMMFVLLPMLTLYLGSDRQNCL